MSREVNYLLASSLIERTVLQGIYPVLPVIVASTGANKKEIGLFMAIIYIAIFLGSVCSPRIIKTKFTVNTTAILIASFLAIFICIMGGMTKYEFLLSTTSVVWFIAGIQQNITTTLMSHITLPESAGLNFGKVANTVLIGTVIGGFLTSVMFDTVGQSMTFFIYGAAIVVSRLLVLCIKPINISVNSPIKSEGKFKASKPFLWLAVAVNIGLMLTHIARFCLSLLMKESGQSVASISANFGWGALLALPLPYVYGRLSQTKPNRILLLTLLFAISICMFLLFSFNNSACFLITSFLISIMAYCSKGVTQKIVYKLYPLSSQVNAQSMLATTNWIAAIIGFVWVSIASDFFTLQQVSATGFVLAVLAAAIVYYKLKID